MKASRAELLVLALVLAAFAAGNVWLARRALQQASSIEVAPRPSAFNAGPSGLRGLYSLWRRLGWPVRVWRRPLTELPEGGGVFVVAAPGLPMYPLRQEEPGRLAAWVRRGGAVVLLGAEPEVAEAFGLRLTGRSSEQEKMGPLGPAAPTELMTGVERLEVGGARWELLAGPAVVHAGDERGAVVVSRPVGAGQVVAVSEPVLANERIAEADHVVLAANLAAVLGAQGPIHFAEHHHGYGERRSLARALARPPALWVTLQVLATAALWLHLASRRFGPPRPVPEAGPRRASSEYVVAMASLLERAGAGQAVLHRLGRALRRDLSRVAGLPADSEAAQLAEAVARRTGAEAARVERLLRTCDAPPAGQGRSGRGPKDSLLVWAGAEAEWVRRQALGGGEGRPGG